MYRIKIVIGTVFTVYRVTFFIGTLFTVNKVIFVIGTVFTVYRVTFFIGTVFTVYRVVIVIWTRLPFTELYNSYARGLQLKFGWLFQLLVSCGPADDWTVNHSTSF